MNAQDQKICTLYEECDLLPEQIAETEGLDLPIVELALWRNSAVFRRLASKEKKDELFNNEDLAAAAAAMRSNLDSEDERVVFRAAEFIINEKKGRHDNTSALKSALKGSTGNINVLVIQQHFAKARMAVERGRTNKPLAGDRGQQAPVIVEAEVTKE